MSAAETGQIHTPAHAPLSEKDFASNPKDQSKDSASSSNMTDALTAPAPAPAVKAPFPHPLPQCKPATPAALTADQEKKYQELLESVKKWEKVPKSTDKKPEEEPLSDDERMWLTKECLLRYLRAVKWASAAAAEKRLLDTVIWRREYGTNTFTADYISPENETGKLIILGYDNDGRPCLYMDPSKQNTEKSDRQVHNLVFMLEKAIDLMPAGVESIALLINFKNSTSAKNPSLGQGKQVLNILQGQYPERNGKSLISERKFATVQTIMNPDESANVASSPLVRLDVLQADLSLHRPRHQGQDEVQRTFRQLYSSVSIDEDLRR